MTPEEHITVSGVRWDGSTVAEQKVVKFSDRSGHVLTFQMFEGVITPSFFSPQLMKKRKDFMFAPDDVYLPGYPRTGTHWANELACMLLNGKDETIPGVKAHLEISADEDIEKLPHPRVINAHMRMSEAPRDLKEKKCKIIFTLRDPKDVAVSNYKITAGNPWIENPYNGSFEDYLYLFMEGKASYNGIFEHWRNAEQFFAENPANSVHLQVYEEAVQNPVESVQKLSDFLGVQRDERLCQAVAAKCEFSRMKVDKDPYTVKIDGEDVIFRQGKPGDWKNYFSEEMLEDYYLVYEEKMAGSRFYNLYARNT